MENMPIFVSVDGAERLKRLSRDLKGKANRELRLRMRRNIRAAAKPVVADVRRAALRVEVSSTKGGVARPDNATGLRVAVSKATNLSITTRGIRIRVSNARLRRMGIDPKLAKYLDASLGRYARWRHPVFGDREVWTEQKGAPFFFTTIRPHLKDFRIAATRAMEETAREITRG